MSVPAIRTLLPNTIIQSWRTSLTKQRGSQPIQPLRSFFSTNSCLSASSPVSPSSSRILSSLRQGRSTSSFLANTPHHHSFSTCSSLSSSFTASPFKTLFTSSHRLTYVQQVFKNGRQNTRNFSLSGIRKAGRPHWYTGSNNQTNLYKAPTGIGRVRRYIDSRIPKSYLFWGIIAANVAVFVLWQYAISSAQRFRDYGPLQFMYKNFTASWANITRPWTLLTSCFSHQDTAHIFVNLFSFYFMGRAALSILSSGQFVGLYLLAGLAGSAVQLLAEIPRMNDGRLRVGLGASGAISGVLTFYAMAFPRDKLLLFFVVPAPAWLAVAGIIGYDMYIAYTKPFGGSGALAHLGGAGAGALYFLKLVGTRGRSW